MVRYKADLKQSRLLARNSRAITSDTAVTSGPTLVSKCVTTGRVRLRDGDGTGQVLVELIAPSGGIAQSGMVEAPNGLFVEVVSGSAYLVGMFGPPPETPPPPPVPEEVTDGILFDYDPAFASNVQVADDTELTGGMEPVDKGPNTVALVWDGAFADNLWWRDGTDGNAPNSKPYWERTEARDNNFRGRLNGNPFSGKTVGECWMVLRQENDPAATVAKEKGPIKFGSDSALAFWPIGDLGGNTRDCYAHFGCTTRTRILHTELVAAGFPVPSLDTWHISRFTVEGTTGANNASQNIYINGVLVKNEPTKTIGHETTPRFWQGGNNSPWGGKMARLQVFEKILTTEEVAQHLAALAFKYGVTLP